MACSRGGSLASSAVAASTQNQAFNALVFLYRVVLEVDLPWLDEIVRARRRESLPTVLTRDEVRRVLERIEGTPRLMVLLLYGPGLRLLECAQLRIKDVDFAANQLVVRSGKGAKDRVTMLPTAAKARLLEQIEAVRRQHRVDLEAGAGWVAVPDPLARKYPNAGRERGVWQNTMPDEIWARIQAVWDRRGWDGIPEA